MLGREGLSGLSHEALGCVPVQGVPPNAEGPWDDGDGAMVLCLVSFTPLSFP